jgi:hypothetical protein
MAAMSDLNALIADLRAAARKAEEDSIKAARDDDAAAYDAGFAAGLMKAVAELERWQS